MGSSESKWKPAKYLPYFWLVWSWWPVLRLESDPVGIQRIQRPKKTIEAEILSLATKAFPVDGLCTRPNADNLSDESLLTPEIDCAIVTKEVTACWPTTGKTGEPMFFIVASGTIQVTCFPFRIENETSSRLLQNPQKQDEKYMSDLTLSFSVYTTPSISVICLIQREELFLKNLKSNLSILWSLKFPNSTDFNCTQYSFSNYYTTQKKMNNAIFES